MSHLGFIRRKISHLLKSDLTFWGLLNPLKQVLRSFRMRKSIHYLFISYAFNLKTTDFMEKCRELNSPQKRSWYLLVKTLSPKRISFLENQENLRVPLYHFLTELYPSVRKKNKNLFNSIHQSLAVISSALDPMTSGFPSINKQMYLPYLNAQLMKHCKWVLHLVCIQTKRLIYHANIVSELAIKCENYAFTVKQQSHYDETTKGT